VKRLILALLTAAAVLVPAGAQANPASGGMSTDDAMTAAFAKAHGLNLVMAPAPTKKGLSPTGTDSILTLNACTDYWVQVNNSGGRLEQRTCVRHTASNWDWYSNLNCFASGGYAENSCNVAAPWEFYIGTNRADSGTAHGVGVDNFTGFWTFSEGTLACVWGNVHADSLSPDVRFSATGTLWHGVWSRQRSGTVNAGGC
jgi:hypothetical protein